MGQVFRATDTKLKREVALKILPEAFTRDPQRMIRFSREAQVLASLNHPNIGAIHGLEESDTSQVLVLELIEGLDLSQRTTQGPIPLDEAIRYALQIVQALEAAHEKGIIHRDLKPANIKITSEGVVKVLDFGLAKAVEGDAGASLGITRSPTLSIAATQAGMILGTPAYMSAEQARGEVVDKRTDIWAFGCVLYEMLSGGKAFAGDTVIDVLAEIVRKDPDWDTLPPEIPRRLTELVGRCLEKDPFKRLRDIGEARIAFETYLADPTTDHRRDETGDTAIRLSALPRFFWAAIPVLLLAVAASSSWLTSRLAGEPVITPVTFSFDLPHGHQQWVHSLAISASGDAIAYQSFDPERGISQLSLRRLDSVESSLIKGTENGAWQAFSPDGKWIVFSTAGELRKVPVSGGEPFRLAEVRGFAYVTWGQDDMITYSSNGEIWRVPANGGDAVRVPVDGEEDETNYRRPAALPSPDHVFVDAMRSGEEWPSIGTLSTTTGEFTELIQEGAHGAYLSSGHLVYARRDGLWAVGFDPTANKIVGNPTPVAQGVEVATASRAERLASTQYAVSDNGVLVYTPAGLQTREEKLIWVDRQGNLEEVGNAARVRGTGQLTGPRLSPDGSQIALTLLDTSDQQIWLYDLSRNNMARFFDEFSASGPLWDATGEWLYFTGGRSDDWDIWRMRTDRSGGPELIVDGDGRQILYGLSRQRALLYATIALDFSSSQLWIKPSEGADAYLLLERRNLRGSLAISPNGEWVLYSKSDRKIWLRSSDPDGGEVPVSQYGGSSPLFSRDGRHIYFTDDRELYEVDFAVADGVPQLSEPRRVTGAIVPSGRTTGYDLSADGERFLMSDAARIIGAESAVRVVVATHWLDELRRQLAQEK